MLCKGSRVRRTLDTTSSYRVLSGRLVSSGIGGSHTASDFVSFLVLPAKRNRLQTACVTTRRILNGLILPDLRSKPRAAICY